MTQQTPAAVPLPFRLSRMISSLWVPQAIHTAAALGLADAMAAGPRSSEDLAAAVGANPGALHRLLRGLVALELCTTTDDGRFELTDLGSCLRSDTRDSVHAWALLMGDRVWLSWSRLLDCVRTGDSVPALEGNATPFDQMTANPEAYAVFSESMVQLTRHLAGAVAAAYDFSGIRTIVDVGGGYGALLPPILKANPEMRGTVADLPLCRDGALRLFEKAGVADRCEFRAVDMFEALPPGADAYIIKSVIHDWDDEKSLDHPPQLPGGDARGLAAAHRRGHRAGSTRHVAARPHDLGHRPQHARGDRRPGAHRVGVSRARRRGRPHRRAHRPDAGGDERHRSAPAVTGLQAEAAPAVAGAVPVRRAALAFIFVTVALDMLSLGIIVPVLPKLVLAFEGGDSASAAAICGLFGTVFSAMQFVFAPLLGALSDRFGRRPVILLSNLALGVDYAIVALAPTVRWLFVGRALAGICGASYTPAGAYIADVTPPERRAAGFGLISAAFGFGFVVGPALGGLAGSVNPRLPFWIAAGLSMANTLYGLLVLPESLPVERRAPFQWKRANPVGALMLLRQHAHVLGIAGVVFLAAIAHEVQPSLFVLYTDYRYGWDTRTVGLVLAAVGVLSAVVGAGLVRVVVERLGERRTLLLGLAFGACGFALYGLAPTGAVLLRRGAAGGAVGPGRPLGAVADDPAGGPVGAGPPPGSDLRRAGRRLHDRPRALHRRLRRLHRHAHGLAAPRRAVPAGGAAPRDGLRARVARRAPLSRRSGRPGRGARLPAHPRASLEGRAFADDEGLRLDVAEEPPAGADLDAARTQHLAADLAQHDQLVGANRGVHGTLRPDDDQIGRPDLALHLPLDASRADERQPTVRLSIGAQRYAYVFPHGPDLPIPTTLPREGREYREPHGRCKSTRKA